MRLSLRHWHPPDRVIELRPLTQPRVPPPNSCQTLTSFARSGIRPHLTASRAAGARRPCLTAAVRLPGVLRRDGTGVLIAVALGTRRARAAALRAASPAALRGRRG